ncbi:MAG: transketolase family protein [Promethearchaeota archaeon]
MFDHALRETFGNFLAENGEKYKDIVVLDADLSFSTRTSKFAKKFPRRFFNMGVAEQNMLGTALGFAILGKTPVVSGFSIFTTGRAWEFIRLACHDKLNVKIITTHGGFVGEDGSTHNALEDLSLMTTFPNLTVLIPADNIELVKILEYAFKTEGPFYIRLPRNSFPIIHDDNYVFSLGKLDVIKDGDDICLIGTGYGTFLGLNSAHMIEDQLKISVKVINLPSIKPIDKNQLITEIKNVKGIVVIEEHNIYCGFGSILARLISENNPTPIRFVGVEDSFGQSGKRKTLLKAYGLNTKNVIKNVNNLLKTRKLSKNNENRE